MWSNVVGDGHSGIAAATRSICLFEQEPGRRLAGNVMTRDEARRIAAKVAKLPELLKPPARKRPRRWLSDAGAMS